MRCVTVWWSWHLGREVFCLLHHEVRARGAAVAFGFETVVRDPESRRRSFASSLRLVCGLGAIIRKRLGSRPVVCAVYEACQKTFMDAFGDFTGDDERHLIGRSTSKYDAKRKGSTGENKCDHGRRETEWVDGVLSLSLCIGLSCARKSDESLIAAL